MTGEIRVDHSLCELSGLNWNGRHQLLTPKPLLTNKKQFITLECFLGSFLAIEAIHRIKVSLVLLGMLLIFENFFNKSLRISAFGNGEKDSAHKYLSLESTCVSLSKWIVFETALCASSVWA